MRVRRTVWGMEPPTTLGPTVLSAAAVAALPSQPLGSLAGVTHRVIWRDGTSTAGVMTIEAGHRLGDHAHRTNSHHLWFVEGSARILGEIVGPGGYVHVPAGVTHDIDATGTAGCTVYYLYLS